MASARALLISAFAMLWFTAVPLHVAHGCGINIVNNCSNAVTACSQSGGNPISQYQIGAGASQNLDFGSTCKWIAGAIWSSITGQCADPVGSTNATDKDLANWAELTIGSGGGVDYYDLSVVDAYNIGMRISVTSSAGGECISVTCSISDIRAFCQGDNKLVTEPSGALSCLNTDGSAGLGPTTNTKYFKAACPQAYPNSDAVSLFTCNTGSDYQVTFCPLG